MVWNRVSVEDEPYTWAVLHSLQEKVARAVHGRGLQKLQHIGNREGEREPHYEQLKKVVQGTSKQEAAKVATELVALRRLLGLLKSEV